MTMYVETGTHAKCKSLGKFAFLFSPPRHYRDVQSFSLFVPIHSDTCAKFCIPLSKENKIKADNSPPFVAGFLFYPPPALSHTFVQNNSHPPLLLFSLAATRLYKNCSLRLSKPLFRAIARQRFVLSKTLQI